MSSTIVGFVDGAIPLVLEEHEFLEFRCCIPVLPEGGGEDRPLDERTARCPHRTRWIKHAVNLANIILSWQMSQRVGDCAAPPPHPDEVTR